MDDNNTKLKRVLGFNASYGAAVGLVVSGTAMFSVSSVAATAGNATFVSAFIGMIPMMMTAFAFGELTAMIPGGGMVSDYTSPALGRFWAAFAVLSGYVMLIACDGGTQLVMGGLTLEQMAGIPQWVVSFGLLALVLLVNIFDVGLYGKVEGIVTVVMMIAYFAMAILGAAGVGEAMGAAQVQPQNAGLLPEGGWSSVFSCVGSAVWFFIGFEFACPMAEENKKPYKNIPYALVSGLITIYVADIIFVHGAVKYTDLNVMALSATPQVDASVAMLGKAGGLVMSFLTIAASFTTANAYMAALPRMLYGMAREKMLPQAFGRLHPKHRVPTWGIAFTVLMILITTAYITIQGGDSETITMFINVACITWLVTYMITMIDVLVLRKKYPDYPRLWKAPIVKVTMPLGIIGALYAIYTLTYVLVYAAVFMAIVAAFIIFWNKKNKQPINEVMPLDVFVNRVRERSEYLAVWDEAVVEWMEKRSAAKG